jgi:predicted RNA binding protein YcfA (HicA-like mRNA interferase family)
MPTNSRRPRRAKDRVGFTITVFELLAFLRSKGYTIQTGHGRHGVKAVRGGQRIPIPAHPGDLSIATAVRILKQAGQTINDVLEWRQQ